MRDLVEARFVDVERLAGAVLHLRDELLRRERRGVAVDRDGADVGARSARDVEDDRGAALRTDERRLGIDRRVEIAGVPEHVLHGDGAVVDGVERKDVAEVEGERAHGAVAVGAAQAFEVDRGDAEVRVEREDDRDAVCRTASNRRGCRGSCRWRRGS